MARGARRQPADAARLARHVHVLPEFLGNRSPYADPDARAVIAGLDLDHDRSPGDACSSPASAAWLMAWPMWSTPCAQQSITAAMMVMSGGASRSALVRQIMAETPTGLSVALAGDDGAGSAGGGDAGCGRAGQFYPTVTAAMESMSAIGYATEPARTSIADFHQAKRRVHGLLQQLDRDSRAVMGG